MKTAIIYSQLLNVLIYMFIKAKGNFNSRGKKESHFDASLTPKQNTSFSQGEVAAAAALVVAVDGAGSDGAADGG